MRIEGSKMVADYNQVQVAAKQQPEVRVEPEVRIVEQVSSKTSAEMPIEERVKNYPEYIPSVAEKSLMNAMSAVNKKLEGINTEFQFSVHETTKEIMVKVLNKDTGEVIREIPSEKVLDMVAKMWELSGIFVDERR